LQIEFYQEDSLEIILLKLTESVSSFPSQLKSPEVEISINHHLAEEKAVKLGRLDHSLSNRIDARNILNSQGIMDENYFSKAKTLPEGSKRKNAPLKTSWDSDVKDPRILVIENYFSPSFKVQTESDMKKDLSDCLVSLKCLKIYIKIFPGRGFCSSYDLRNPELFVELQGLLVKIESFINESKMKNKIEVSLQDLSARDEDDLESESKFIMKLDSHVPLTKKRPFFDLQIYTVRAKLIDELRIHTHVCPIKIHVRQKTLHLIEQLSKISSKFSLSSSQKQEAFVQRFSMDSFEISLDYTNNSSEMDLKQFFRIFPIRDARLKFQSRNMSGIYGFSNLFDKLYANWRMEATNQKAQIALGLRPIRSTVNVGSGVLDLVIIPAQGIQNGEAMRGVLEGSQSALQKIASEVFGLAGDIFKLTHAVILKLERKVSRNPTNNLSSLRLRQSRQSEFSESLNLARDALNQVLDQAAENLIIIPANEYNSRGLGHSFKAAVLSVPSSLLQGIRGLSEAAALTMRGARNSLAKERVHIAHLSGDR
jgi:hypothetical protein